MPKKTSVPPVDPAAAHPIAAAIGRTLGMMAKSTGLVHSEPVAEPLPAKKKRAPAKKKTVKKQVSKPAAKKLAPKKQVARKKPSQKKATPAAKAR